VWGTDEKSDLCFEFGVFQANFVNSLQGLIFWVISARKLVLDTQSRFPSEGLNIQRLNGVVGGEELKPFFSPLLCWC